MPRSGRPIRPAPSPASGTAQFAWLMRCLRVQSQDPDVQDVRAFAASLHVPRPYQPETLNKLERGQHPFAHELIRAYEVRLGLPPFSLVDVAVYAARHSGVRVRWPGQAEVVGPQETLYGLAYGEHAPVGDLLLLCVWLASAGKALLVSPRWHGLVTTAVLDAFAEAYEGDERLLREALVLLGETAVPAIVERVRDAPLPYFNAVEALGFMTGRASWAALRDLLREATSPISMQIVLECVRRRLRDDPGLVVDLQQQVPDIGRWCLRALADPLQAFTVREEAAAMLRLLPVRPALDTGTERVLRELIPDLGQLHLRPALHRPEELVREVGEWTEGAFGPTAVLGVVDGLESVVRTAVYGVERQERLGAAVVLSRLPASDSAARAIGRALGEVDRADYGIQRSVVRVLTKMGRPAGLQALSVLARRTSVHDEGLRLALAWGLSLAADPADLDSLERLAAGGTAVTRQVAQLSLRRRRPTG